MLETNNNKVGRTVGKVCYHKELFGFEKINHTIQICYDDKVAETMHSKDGWLNNMLFLDFKRGFAMKD